MTANNQHILALRKLWQQAFKDSDAVLDAFFATGFSPERCNYICVDDTPICAVYWFDCTLDNHKLAYLYAMATEKAHQSKGFAHRLMAHTHRHLAACGYEGAILVPGSKKLFALYKELGYQTISYVTEFSCERGNSPVSLKEIDTHQYAQLRRQYLPAGGVIQEGALLDFLHTQARFYLGDDFLMAASTNTDTLYVQELLGNTQAASGILHTLNLSHGQFRTPGYGREFAMFHPLWQNCPVPSYLGLALD